MKPPPARRLEPMRAALVAGNALGEGIVWCERRQTLYWTDIPAAALWSLQPASGATRQWKLPERLSALALCEAEEWLLLALASRLAFLHLDAGWLYPLCEVEPELPTRCNDGACDRAGRFVFGTKHEPAGTAPLQPRGGFWRLHADLRLERLPLEGVAISNSVAFSPDGRTMYYCDSSTRVLRCCAYGDRLGPSRILADLGGLAGEPDGSAVDAEGGLWNAQWGLRRVVRYLPDGLEDCILPVPARLPTRPAFGGPDFSTLYVTSARTDAGAESSDSHAPDLLGGTLFRAAMEVRGLPEARFSGTPPERGERIKVPILT